MRATVGKEAKIVLERISLLLWKNSLIFSNLFRKRRYIIVTGFQVILPTLLVLLITPINIITGNTGRGVSFHKAVYFGVVKEEVALRCAAKDFSSPGHLKATPAGVSMAFTPNNPFTSGVMTRVKGRLPNATFVLQPFSTEAEIEVYMANIGLKGRGGGVDKPRIRVVIVFDKFPPGPETSYRIRLINDDERRGAKKRTIEMTDQLVPGFQPSGPDCENANIYHESGFTGLQIAIDKTLIEVLTGKYPTLEIFSQAFPHPPYFVSLARSSYIYFIVLPYVMVLGFIFIVPFIIGDILAEKETGIKELMKMMGAWPYWMHWIGWMFSSLLIFTPSFTILTAVLFIPIPPSATFAYSDITLFWFVLLLYAVAATSFCFLISTFFQRPVMGTAAGIGLCLVTYFVPVLSMEPKYQFLSFSLKMASCLIPNVALHWVISVISRFEWISVGGKWRTIAQSPSPVDDLSIGWVVFMLILDTIIYMTLTIYVENVIPGEFKSWKNPFQAARWRRMSKTNRVTPIPNEIHEDPRIGFEEEPTGLGASVVISNLKKTFGQKVAVDMEGTLKMYEGQITVLLGHKGAGKTTTLSMVTGVLAPSSGTVVVNGFDMATSMDSARKNLGLCPQRNMLFGKLTVEQNLIFFGQLKGLRTSRAEKETKSLLSSLRLVEQKGTFPGDLSVGQQRNLSLGIALIGGTKVVVLDALTSGMDHKERRATWNLLLGMRGERTIILTTRLMEGAEMLGDRIAIMADGKVKSCGSPTFLKKYYGAGTGFTLKIRVEDPGIAGNLLSVVQNEFPAASVQNGRNPNSPEVSITVPNEGNPSPEFRRLFTTLSERKEELGILTLGLGLITMDELFVKFGAENAPSGDKILNLEPEAISVIGRRSTGLTLTVEQFTALIWKHMLYTLRKRKLWISQFFIPLGLLIFCILLSNWSFSRSTYSPPLKMDLSPYKNPVTLFRDSAQALGTPYSKTVGSSAKSTPRDLIDELHAIGKKGVGAYRAKYVVAGELSDSSVLLAMFSSIPIHASPISINFMSNAILRSTPGWRGQTIRVTSHPLDGRRRTVTELFDTNPGYLLAVPLIFAVILPLGLALSAASFIVFPIEEKRCKVKQLQMMTSLSPIMYWGSGFLWDFVVMFLLVCLMVTCLPIFQTYGAFTSFHGAGVFFLILLFFGFAAIPFSYLGSIYLGTVLRGFTIVTLVNFIPGVGLAMLVSVFEIFPFADVARMFGRLLPGFSASVSILRFSTIATKNLRCIRIPETIKKIICNPSMDLQAELRYCCPKCTSFRKKYNHTIKCFKPEAYLTWNYDLMGGGFIKSKQETHRVPGIGQDLFFLFLIGLLYQGLLLAIEYGFAGRVLALIFKPPPPAIFQGRQAGDENVLLENQRVAEMVAGGRVSEDALVVENFCKSYGTLTAVAGLSFGVHHGECFGLLGVNGAGKTTSLRILTGDESRYAGNAFGNRLTLERDRTKFLSLIGYCPQSDGIIGVLTGREMLQLFCRLRGVPLREADKWLRKLGLLEAGNVQCQKYSGGMKRRLCAGIALIGDPPIILLDEPTSGVDPIGRRQFWKVISSVRDAGQAVVLASDSIEECEALCSRLGIMANGQFQCLGSVKHLRKFSQEITLVVELKMASADQITRKAIRDQIRIKFSPSTVKYKDQNILEVQLTNPGISWGQILQSLEDLRAQYPEVIEEYSLSDRTLEAVFSSFANKPLDGREVNR